MTITNKLSALKIATFVAGFALVLTSFAPVARAQLTAEVQAQIAALLAQVAALQTQTGGSATVAAFTRDLTLGSTGADVTSLQNWLISNGYTIPAGATGYFGTQTQAAVARYQAANGIAPAAGYFGPLTRTNVNAKIVIAPTPTPTPDTDDDDNDDELRGGAGSLRDADFISSLNNEQVGENDEAEVLGLELEARDSDLRLTAARVSFELTAGVASDDFDDYAEEVVISLDGDEIGSIDVDDMSERNGVWTANITLDRDAIIRMNDTEDFVVSVVALRSIDSSDLNDNTWTATVDSIRVMDAQGAIITETNLGNIGDGRNFEFASFSSANDVELMIDESDDSPDAGTVEVDEDGDDEVTLLVGELSAEGADIDLGELGMTVSLNGGGATTTDVANVVSEFLLFIDGDQVASIDADECTVAANCDGGDGDNDAVYVFNNLRGITIDEGDTVEFEIIAVLNEIDATGFPEGTSLTVSVDDDQIEAEVNRDDLGTGEINGAASGEEITLRSTGLAVDFDEDESDASTNGNVGEFTFVLDVEAFGDDVAVAKSDLDYTVTGPDTGSISTILDGSRNLREQPSDTFTVDEGEDGTLTFTIYVSIDGAADNGVYRATLNSVGDTAVNESLTTYIAYRS